MATRKGVGRINEPVKLLDEYQLEVPDSFKQSWTFNSEADAKAFVEACLAKKMIMDGHCVKEGKFKCDPDDNGVYTIVYCPVGEMVVRCVEKAAQLMKSPVHITGEYLTGLNWGDCH